MKNYFWLLLLLFLLLFAGCASDYAPVFSSAINEAGENVSSVSGYVKDASISKESVVHTTLQTYYKEYGKAYGKSGFSMEFQMVELMPGVNAYLPKKLSFKETPNFAALKAPPTEPSRHPVWQTVDNLVDKGMVLGLGYFVSDFLKSTQENNGYNFYGDSPNLSNSFNTAANDQEFTSGSFYNGEYSPTEVVFEPEGTEEEVATEVTEELVAE